MSEVKMEELLNAGVHFGHQTSRWNPKMKQYIFGEKNGIYIIDLGKTVTLFKEALTFLEDVASDGRKVLFVGTKKQASDIVQSEAKRCNMYYVDKRWLGGMLTNFKTISASLARLKKLEKILVDGTAEKLPKKEVLQITRDIEKLNKFLGGIKDMTHTPSALFIIDPKKEKIAVKEAVKLGIPVVGLVDTNCDPNGIDYLIPGNDDAIRSIRLITSMVSEACMRGRDIYESKVKEMESKEGPKKEKRDERPVRRGKRRDAKGREPRVVMKGKQKEEKKEEKSKS